MTNEEIQNGIADMIADLRIRSHSTREDMARIMGVDRKTYNNYERGISSPPAQILIQLFSALHQDALKSILDLLYPDIYHGLCEDDVGSLKSALIHYIENVASDREIIAWSYLIHGSHGSNWRPQLEEFVALDHLPLVNRIAIATLIDEFYKLASQAGHLVSPGFVEPDMDVFRAGLKAGREAAYSGHDKYSSSSNFNEFNVYVEDET